MDERQHWGEPCYDSVGWPRVSEDSNLLYRVEDGSWALTFVSTVVAGTAGTLAYELLEPMVQRKLRERRSLSVEDVHERVAQLEDLIPFVGTADVFLGQRRPWMADKFEGVREFLDDLGDRPEDELYDLDQIAGYSTNELLQTLDFLVTTNLALHDEGPVDVFSDSTLEVDFGRDLIAIGGPISNHYTRNLMYGDHVDLPYRYDLNPDDGSDDIADIPPTELRELGLTDERGFDERPNWRLVDRNGNLPRIRNRATKPMRRNGVWKQDYFTIIKAPNIHPSARKRVGTETYSLVLSGCHGLGTRAAIRALQTEHVLDTLDEEAGDGFFQAIGSVKQPESGAIDADRIVVEPEHVELLDV